MPNLTFRPPKNARFWTFHRNGWVKFTLRPDQALNHAYSSADDEGHSWAMEGWEYCVEFVEGDHADLAEPSIVRRWAGGGRDCDGVCSSSGDDICPVSKLAAIPAHAQDGILDRRDRDPWGRPIRRPDWQQYKATRCRDSFAEAAGY
jgi:hypothetical protein